MKVAKSGCHHIGDSNVNPSMTNCQNSENKCKCQLQKTNAIATILTILFWNSLEDCAKLACELHKGPSHAVFVPLENFQKWSKNLCCFVSKRFQFSKKFANQKLFSGIFDWDTMNNCTWNAKKTQANVAIVAIMLEGADNQRISQTIGSVFEHLTTLQTHEQNSRNVCKFSDSCQLKLLETLQCI